jgi:hypothetical protein
MAKKAAVKTKRKPRARNGNGFGPSCIRAPKKGTKKKKAGKKR